jgi:hypothetical protein
MTTNYEYKVMEVKPEGNWGKLPTLENIETQLNVLAREGWELVNSLVYTDPYDGTFKSRFIFKRQTTF